MLGLVISGATYAAYAAYIYYRTTIFTMRVGFIVARYLIGV
jgi:hypothetical protein